MIGDDTDHDHHAGDGGGATPAVPWLPDTLDAGLLAVAYGHLGDFVAWLRELTIDVPQCWYVHGWAVHRLLALQHWHAQFRDGHSSPRATVDSWAAGLQPLVRDWEDLFAHHGRHAPTDDPYGDAVTMPALEVVIEEAVRRRRERAS
jgi:hypothetical protein